ncbi:MAG: 1-acyl-sn-glycerol-3-phosphate acyltransferase [Cyclobacteriaceae bacterium]|nr:1-acyl-sn-glycerol-3-phosphate acyltransferase [Cyclobacteriaceae bacterium]
MKRIRKTIHYVYYNTLYFLLSILIRFYFRQWQVANYKGIPHKGPVIFAANHQNAFLDALVILFSQPRSVYYLVRANIFESATARFWLESLRMLPIYRVRDGIRSVAKNDEIIDKCVGILSRGHSPLTIFAEGNHNLRRALRPLQKGIARIAFAAMEANNFDLDLAVVPIGLNYGRHTRFRSDMLVNYGEPIYVKDYIPLYKENPNKAYLKLVDDLYQKLDERVLSIRPTEYYEQIENEWLHKRTPKHDLIEQFNADKELLSQLEDKYSSNPVEISDEAKAEPIPPTPSLAYRILMFPVFIYGYINSYPSYYLLNLIIKKVVSDIHFYGSVKKASNLIIAPLLFLVQAFIVYLLVGNGVIALLYFISLPFTGILAYDYKFAVFDKLPRMKGVAGYKI